MGLKRIYVVIFENRITSLHFYAGSNQSKKVTDVQLTRELHHLVHSESTIDANNSMIPLLYNSLATWI